VESHPIMSEVTLHIDGMHCGACIRRVSQALERTPGTEVVEVRVGAARIKTEDAAQALAAIRKAGYAARLEN